jgi:flagellar hook-length control protein FliK
MPSTATTNVSVSTLLDVLGAPTSAPAVNKVQPAFDVLLQPPPTPAPALPAAPEKPAPAARSEEPADQRPAAPQQTSSNAGPSQTSDDSSESHDDQSSRPQLPPTTTEPKQSNEKANDDHNQAANEPVVAESLAGLAAVAPPSPPINATPDTAEATVATTDEKVEATAAAAKRPAAAPVAVGQPTPTKVAKAENTDKARPEGEAVAGDAAHETVVATSVTRPEGKDSVADPAKAAQVAKATDVERPTDQLSGDQPAAGATPSTPDAMPALHAARDIPTSTDASPRPDAGTSALQASPAALANINNLPPPPAVAVGAPTAIVDAAPSANTTSSASGVQSNAPAQRSRLPAELLSQGPTGPARRATVEIDANRLLTRVARAFTAAQERDGEVRLRLSPPELGALRLEVRVQDGAMVAHIQTETDAAKTAILDNLPTLRDRLADQGVRIERFDVDLMQRQPGGGGMPDQPGSRQQESPAPALQIAPAPRPRADVSGVQSTAAANVDSTSGLNVII